MSARLASYAPIMLSVLRIIAALIFLEHGTQKILGFPPGGPVPLPHPGEMLWWAGMIEMIPGFLLLIGLYSRTAAFLAAGEMAFAYWIVLPTAVPFLLNFDSDVYNSQVRAREYYSFAAVTILACGILFELPIFILGLVRLGIVSAMQLRQNRRIGVGLCIVAVVLLPGVDFVSMGLQALPILILFEASIWVAVYFERRWEAAGVLREPLAESGDS